MGKQRKYVASQGVRGVHELKTATRKDTTCDNYQEAHIPEINYNFKPEEFERYFFSPHSYDHMGIIGEEANEYIGEEFLSAVWFCACAGQPVIVTLVRDDFPLPMLLVFTADDALVRTVTVRGKKVFLEKYERYLLFHQNREANAMDGSFDFHRSVRTPVKPNKNDPLHLSDAERVVRDLKISMDV